MGPIYLNICHTTKITSNPRFDMVQQASTFLRKVDLTVSTKDIGASKLYYEKFIGTDTVMNANGEYMSPCAGDSGGPLMFKDKSSGRWILIGKNCHLKLIICHPNIFRGWVYLQVTYL